MSTTDMGHSRPLHVLHVIPSISYVHGGPSRAIVAMERALTAAGVLVTTATTDDNGLHRRLCHSDRPAEVNGASRIYCRKWSEFYKFAPGLVPWLWLNVRRFDVVHIHAMFSFSSVAAGVVAWVRGVPYIIRPLGTLARYGVRKRRPLLKRLSLQFVEAPLLRNAASVQCTSVAELEEMRALGLTFNGVVIPLGVEQTTLNKAQEQATGHVHNKTMFTVLYLSRLDPKKNIENLLEAFCNVTKTRPNVRLRIAGHGSKNYLRYLKGRAAELSLNGRIEWLGHVDGQEKAMVFSAADIFVLPSYSENFGIAAVEAMLEGIPCIIAEGVGIAPEVKAADAGLIVAPESSSIAAALGDLLDDRDLREGTGERARQFALQHYSIEAMAHSLILLYASHLNSKTTTERKP